MDDLLHPDHLVRHHAAAELRRAGDRAAVPALIELVETEGRGHWLPWITGIQALAAFGDTRACPALVGALGSAELTVRIEAALALAEAGDERAFDALRAVVANAAEEEYLRRTAASTLAVLGAEPESPGHAIDVRILWERERAHAERQARWEKQLDAALEDDGLLADAVAGIGSAAEAIADAADTIADAVGDLVDGF